MTFGTMIDINNDHAKLFSKFLLTLMSSWIVGPSGVLFLHFWGWGDSSVLIALLLALSAGVPMQLLLNEFVAPGAVAGNFFASPTQVAGVLAATFAAIWFALLSSNDVHGASPLVMAYPLLALLTATSIWLSYLISLHYYAATVSGNVSYHGALYVGIAPGLTTLIAFAAAAFSGEPYLLLAAAILPAIVQILILRWFVPVGDLRQAHGQVLSSKSSLSGKRKPSLSHIVLLIIGLVLIATGVGSAILRDIIASWQQSYAAIILVSLNLMGTIAISLSRAIYLSSETNIQRGAGSATIIFMIISITIYTFSNIASALAALFALQFLIVTVLELGRQRMSLSKQINDCLGV